MAGKVFLSPMPWDFWLICSYSACDSVARPVAVATLIAFASRGTKEKLALYGTTIAFQWVLMGLVAWRAFARGLPALTWDSHVVRDRIGGSERGG